MNASVLPKYLLGSKSAILEVANSPMSFIIGLVFVISAGLAREYDGEDLIHQPWHALRPLGASLVSGTILFLVIHLAALLNKHRPPSYFGAWRSFMGLFWMTAPMAWLYAIPYEHMMTPVGAVSLNLWTLAIVAAWRVWLIARVISVVYGIGGLSSFFLVMFFADAVTFTVVTLAPTPVIDVMGGIRHTDRDALIAEVTFSVTILSVMTAPVWLIGALIATARLKPQWPEPNTHPAERGSRGLLRVAVLAVVAFIPLLILSQPEQINKHRVETLFKQGRVDEALDRMSALQPNDYPSHWDPPPRLGYRENKPDLDRIRDAMATKWPADWVADLYLAKIGRKLKQSVLYYWADASWSQIVDEIQEYAQYYSNGSTSRVSVEQARTARFLLDYDDSLGENDRRALERLIAIATPTELESIDESDQIFQDIPD